MLWLYLKYIYFDYKYISPCESTWRIFGFPIHDRKPSVERLQFNLLGQHSVLYQDHDDIDDLLSNPSISESKFITWMNTKDWGSAPYLRNLFVLLLLTGTMNKPEEVWEKTWHWLSDDIVYSHRRSSNTPGWLTYSLTQKTLIINII